MKQSFLNIPPHHEGGFSYLRSPLTLVLCSICALVLLACFLPSPIAGIDSGLKWLSAKQFSESNSIAIAPVTNAVFAQDELPPCPEPFIYWNRNTLYPVYSVLPIILNGIIDKLFGGHLWWFWSTLPACFLLGLTLYFARRKQLPVPTTLVLLLFATPLTIYAVTYWEHALAAALVTVATLLELRRFKLALLGAFLLGIVPWIRTETLGWSVCVLLFTIGTIPICRLAAYFVVMVCGLLAGSLLNHLMTGSWLPLQVIANFETGQTLLSQLQNGSFPYLTYLSLFFGAGAIGWSLVLCTLIIAGVIGWRRNAPYSTLLVLVPLLYVVSRIMEPLPVFTMIRANGLLFTMPAVVLAPWGWKFLPNKRIWLGALIGIVLSVLAMGEVSEGIHWSVRYLLPIAFPISIAAVYALRERPLSKVNYIIGAVGILALTMYGIVWYANIENRQIEFTRELNADPRIIATDVAWVGGDAAPLLRDREILFLPDVERIGRFLLNLNIHRISSFQYVRMSSAIPLTQAVDGNWMKLVRYDAKRFVPTPEAGTYYRIEGYKLTDDSLAYSQLAGELAALRFARGDMRGIDDAHQALQLNMNDYRPAVALLAFGIETGNVGLVQEQLDYGRTHPIPEKYQSLIEQGVKLLNNQCSR